jgi:predicted GNAT family N-acyltransferase
MIVTRIEFATPDYDESVQLRTKILREPLGLSFTTEQLAAEYLDTHFAAFDEEGVLRGILLMLPKDTEVVKMRQVAVAADVQGRGIGRALVVACEAWAKLNQFKTIELHARDYAISFYEKLGYECVGDWFSEVNILHKKLIKNL